MKKTPLSTKKMFPRRVIELNKSSLESMEKYREAIEAIDKVRFPHGKQVIYKQVGVNTTDLPLNIYGTITTG